MYYLSAFLSYVPLDRPLAAFLIPVFSTAQRGNVLYMQELDARAVILKFYPVDPANYYVIEGVPLRDSFEVGSKGLLAARLNDGRIVCDRYTQFFRTLAGMDLSKVGSPFFNVDAYLMLRDFPSREKAIGIASQLFRNSKNAEAWARMENQITDSGMFLPEPDATLEQSLLAAVRASADLRQQIEAQINRLKMVHKSNMTLPLQEGEVNSVRFLVPRNIDITGVRIESPLEQGQYMCHLNFITRMGAEALMAAGGSVIFDTMVQSGARMVVRFNEARPLNLKIEGLDLHDYIMEDNELIRQRVVEPPPVA